MPTETKLAVTERSLTDAVARAAEAYDLAVRVVPATPIALRDNERTHARGTDSL